MASFWNPIGDNMDPLKKRKKLLGIPEESGRAPVPVETQGPIVSPMQAGQSDPDAGDAQQNSVHPGLRRMFQLSDMAGGGPGSSMLQSRMKAPPTVDDASALGGRQAQSFQDRYGQLTDADEPSSVNSILAQRDYAAENGGEGLATPPASNTPWTQLTGTKKILADIDEAKATPAKKENRFWNRLGSGAIQGLKMYTASGGQGGIAGLLASLATGGAIGAASPRALGEYKKQVGINKMWGQYGQQAQVEENEAKQLKLNDEANMASLKLLREQYKPLYDSITADDVVDDDDVARAAAVGIPLKKYDARTFDSETVNGQPMTKPHKGAPIWMRNPTLANDISKTPKDLTIDTENGPTTISGLNPGQQASTIVGLEQANANRKAAAQKQVADLESKSQGDVQSWEQRQNKARAQRQKATASLTALQQGRDELAKQGLPTDDMDKSIANMKGDLAEAEELLKERKPIARSTSANKGGKKKYSKADIDRYTQQVINQ